MISKRIKANKQVHKSKSQHISDLYNYINGLDPDHSDEDKVLFTGTLNINESDDDAIITEIARLARASVKSTNPINHWTLSLPAGETFTEQSAREIVTKFMNDLGYKDCQVVWGVHSNTDNMHIHIMVNRVDPTTLKCIPRGNDIFKAQKSIAQIVHKYGYSELEHQPYIVDENGNLQKNIYTKNEATKSLPEKVIGSEIRTGEKSMLRVAIEKILPILKSAKTWIEVHTKLAEEGFEYRTKTGGGILVADCKDKEISIKSSSVHRSVSMKNMEKRLGPYIPSQAKVQPRQPEPIPGVSHETLKRFKDEKNNKKKPITNTDDIKKIEVLDQIKSLEVEQELTIPKIYHADPHVEAALRRIYIEHTREQLKNLNSVFRSLSSATRTPAPQRMAFDQWLKEDFNSWKENNADEIFRRLHDGIPINVSMSTEDGHILYNFINYHDAVQADKYKVSATLKDTNIVLLKESDKSSIYTPDEIKSQIIPKALDLGKKFKFHLEPISDKYKYINISTPNIEQLQSDGLRPSCIIQIPNKNYDAIFRIPSVKPEIVTKISNELVEKYSIKQAEPTHEIREKVVESTSEPCHILTPFATQLDRFYTYQHENKQQKKQNDSDYHKLYKVHYDHILQHSKFTDDDVDKLDGMIAIRLRATGHNQSAIAKIIAAGHAGSSADRIAEDAFSENGDRQIKRYVRFLKDWKLLEERLNLQWYAEQKENVVDKHEMEEQNDKLNIENIAKHEKKVVEKREDNKKIENRKRLFVKEEEDKSQEEQQTITMGM